jgi:hypothetical protein
MPTPRTKDEARYCSGTLLSRSGVLLKGQGQGAGKSFDMLPNPWHLSYWIVKDVMQK